VTGTDDTSDDFLAACVQFDVRAGDVAANCAAMRAGVEEAVASGARLCVLPEMWSTSFLPAFAEPVLAEAEAAENELRELSALHGLVIVGSSVEALDDRVWNTARVYESGHSLGSYRKIHLFSPNAEHRHFTAGEEPLVVTTRLGVLGVLICYDLRFPELARYYFHRGVELLVVPGQWPEARAAHWRTLLRARAMENEMFVIGSNRTGQEPSLRNDEMQAFPGDGRIVDPTGEVLASGSGESGAIVAHIERRKVRTMRRIMPVDRDQRPHVYRRLFDEVWPRMIERSREGSAGTNGDDD
jgi:predicted amidohydrolase